MYSFVPTRLADLVDACDLARLLHSSRRCYESVLLAGRAALLDGTYSRLLNAFSAAARPGAAAAAAATSCLVRYRISTIHLRTALL